MAELLGQIVYIWGLRICSYIKLAKESQDPLLSDVISLAILHFRTIKVLQIMK